jgi:hypothetical protein
MRVAALVLGVIGGVFGIFASIFALGVGGLGSAVGSQGASTVIGLGWSAMFFCLLGFLGSGLAMAKPKAAALLLLISALGFIVSVSAFAVVTGPLFLIASLLAFLGRGPRQKEVAQQTQ